METSMAGAHSVTFDWKREMRAAMPLQRWRYSFLFSVNCNHHINIFSL